MNKEVSLNKFSNSKHTSDQSCSFLAEILLKLVRRKAQYMKLCLSIKSEYQRFMSLTKELDQKVWLVPKQSFSSNPRL